MPIFVVLVSGGSLFFHDFWFWVEEGHVGCPSFLYPIQYKYAYIGNNITCTGII